MEKKMETTILKGYILRLFMDKGRDNGDYYIK